MYISNDRRNRHFVIKEETGGNNNQSTCSFGTSVLLNPLLDSEATIFLFLKSYLGNLFFLKQTP